MAKSDEQSELVKRALAMVNGAAPERPPAESKTRLERMMEACLKELGGRVVGVRKVGTRGQVQLTLIKGGKDAK